MPISRLLFRVVLPVSVLQAMLRKRDNQGDPFLGQPAEALEGAQFFVDLGLVPCGKETGRALSRMTVAQLLERVLLLEARILNPAGDVG